MSEPLPPDEPTAHPAGSPEKIQVMRDRAAAGQALHHPDDSPGKVAQRPDPEPPPGVPRD